MAAKGWAATWDGERNVSILQFGLTLYPDPSKGQVSMQNSYWADHEWLKWNLAHRGGAATYLGGAWRGCHTVRSRKCSVTNVRCPLGYVLFYLPCPREPMRCPAQ